MEHTAKCILPCRLYEYTGSLVPYQKAWHWQQELIRLRVEQAPQPQTMDTTSTSPDAAAVDNRSLHPDLVLMLEHPHVYTLGRGASESHLKFDPQQQQTSLLPAPVDVHRVERGGKITYHGPGQLVVYPLLDLCRYNKDLHWYVTTIEDVIIDVLAHFGFEAGRAKGYPGVWVGDKKVAQVGMNCNRWYTMHGFAINVAPDMEFFNFIVPCGIFDKDVTSIERLLRERHEKAAAAAMSVTAAAGGGGDGVVAVVPSREELMHTTRVAVKDAFQRRFGVEFLSNANAADATDELLLPLF